MTNIAVSGSFNTIVAVEQNVRQELRELEIERVKLTVELRRNAEQYVRAMMHCAVADALDSGESR